MAVTNFSPLLGLALPTTGDLSGTWGTTVNDSITGLLDTAVAGTTTLSTDADVTLSTTNGAANQARSAVLLCTGARTVQRTITAPAQSKAYIVINNTTGGFAVKVVGAGPTTGVTIANGEKALIAWNGSDFVLVSAIPIDLTTDVTGTLPATNGGTGQSSYAVGDLLFASTTSALSKLADVATGNALISGGVGVAPSYGKIGLTTHVSGTLPVANGGTGVTTSTGSGSVVLSTSPALTTPNLGTPSAATLTNATGLPLTTGVTGTLGVANGGTGLSSTPVNGALDIGNGTGFTRATLTAGSGVSISNASGSITISATGSGGTVTSVGATAPVASSGGTAPTISLNSAYGDTLNPYASKTANFFLAAPNGTAGAPTFRAIAAADVPTLNQNTTGTASNVTGIVAVANGGTGQTSYTNGQLLIGNTTGNTLTKATLTAGSGVTITNGNGSITISASSGGFTKVSTTYTAVNGDKILADTSAGSFTISLPATPSTGQTVEFQDSAGTWGINALTVGRNGSTIMGIAEDMVASNANMGFGLVYNGSDWRVY